MQPLLEHNRHMLMQLLEQQHTTMPPTPSSLIATEEVATSREPTAPLDLTNPTLNARVIRPTAPIEPVGPEQRTVRSLPPSDRLPSPTSTKPRDDLNSRLHTATDFKKLRALLQQYHERLEAPHICTAVYRLSYFCDSGRLPGHVARCGDFNDARECF